MRNAILKQADNDQVELIDEFRKRLADIARAAENMREQLLDLMPSAPRDSAEWGAEMSCNCGQCDPCSLRAKVGDEQAEKQIRTTLRPPERSRLVGPNGRAIH
jgi:hypothetical protein